MSLCARARDNLVYRRPNYDSVAAAEAEAFGHGAAIGQQMCVGRTSSQPADPVNRRFICLSLSLPSRFHLDTIDFTTQQLTRTAVAPTASTLWATLASLSRSIACSSE